MQNLARPLLAPVDWWYESFLEWPGGYQHLVKILDLAMLVLRSFFAGVTLLPYPEAPFVVLSIYPLDLNAKSPMLR